MDFFPPMWTLSSPTRDEIQFSSVQFSCSVVSDSLWPHGLQHAMPSCPSPTPGVYLNSCPLSQWYHPMISSSVVPISSRLQSFPASGSFQMSQFFASGVKVLEFQLQHQSFQAPCIGSAESYHWTVREVPGFFTFSF